MKININNTTIEFNFHFSQRSNNLREQVWGILQNEKPFVLYSLDKDFQIFIPNGLYGISQEKEIIKYHSYNEFEAALSLALMLYDHVEEIPEIKLLEEIKLIS